MKYQGKVKRTTEMKLIEKVKIHPEVIIELNSKQHGYFCTAIKELPFIHTKKQVANFSAFPYMLECWNRSPNKRLK